METSTTQVTVVTNQNILNLIAERGTTKNAVARSAGIPATTFDRNLRGKTSWTIVELGSVADTLGLDLIDLVTAKAARS